jgi:hypothetical protein
VFHALQSRIGFDHYLESLFAAADIDDDGSLTLQEFSLIIQQLAVDMPENQVKSMYREGMLHQQDSDLEGLSPAAFLKVVNVPAHNNKKVVTMMQTTDKDKAFDAIQQRWETESQNRFQAIVEEIEGDSGVRQLQTSDGMSSLLKRKNQVEMMLQALDDPIAAWLSLRMLEAQIADMQKAVGKLRQATSRIQNVFRNHASQRELSIVDAAAAAEVYAAAESFQKEQAEQEDVNAGPLPFDLVKAHAQDMRVARMGMEQYEKHRAKIRSHGAFVTMKEKHRRRKERGEPPSPLQLMQNEPNGGYLSPDSPPAQMVELKESDLSTDPGN